MEEKINEMGNSNRSFRNENSIKDGNSGNRNVEGKDIGDENWNMEEKWIWESDWGIK